MIVTLMNIKVVFEKTERFIGYISEVSLERWILINVTSFSCMLFFVSFWGFWGGSGVGVFLLYET